ncbi:MAG TPA: hypothetical protein VM364_06845 [Vicinamibacterales bacterium]|nr:hypothetical protein [Vicinamibacterales bacterium]
MLNISRTAAVLTTVAFALSLAAPAASQDSKSAPLARQLAQLLDAQKVDSIAAADPETGGFVAAIYVPGTQLLVVGGKFASPDIGNYRLSKNEFRELYMDLTGGSDPASRIFASDVSADGLVISPKGDAPADVWEHGTTKRAFLGARKARLKEDEYLRVYSEADAQYARMLALLVAQAKPKTS